MIDPQEVTLHQLDLEIKDIYDELALFYREQQENKEMLDRLTTKMQHIEKLFMLLIENVKL